MPLPLVLVPLVEYAVANVARTSLTVLGSSLLAYYGYDSVQSVPKLFGSAPSGTNTTRVTFPTKKPAPVAPVAPTTPANPSIVNALSPALSSHSASQTREKNNTVALSSALASAGNAVKERNNTLTQTAGASKFLVNQVEGKAAIDEVSFAINAQSVVQAMIYETLDRNLSLISAALVASAQVSQYGVDQAKTNASALVTISDRLEPFEDNQIHHRTIASPIPMDSVTARTSASPRELAHARDFALSRGEADTNSIGATTLEQVEELFSDMDLTPDMFKNYIRFDTILNQVAADVDTDSTAWEQLMEDFFK